MRCDATGRVYFHPRYQKHYFKGDGKTYKYVDLESNRRKTIDVSELSVLVNSLPVECQQILLKNKEERVPLTMEEQKKLLFLCSLSIYVWKGSPRAKLPCTSMKEYEAEFYMQMVKFLTRDGKSRYNPKRACWISYVRFIRCATMEAIAKQWNKLKPLLDSFTSIPGGVENRRDDGWDAVVDNLNGAY